MRILILSCGTGGGHNDAGRGLAEALRARGHEAVFLDQYLGLAGSGVDKAVCGAYVETVKRMPTAFRAVYTLGRGVSSTLHAAGMRSPVYWANGALAGQIESVLQKGNFDAVLMPHLFPAETITCLKRAGAEVPLSVAVATDYTCIPFWEETACDLYVVPAAPGCVQDFCRRGVPQEKLVPLGIPAPAAFTPEFDREATRRSLGFAPGRQYILIMGGSMGAGDLGRLMHLLLRRMRPHTELIAMTGSNTALRERLTQEFSHEQAVTILPQVECAAPYMQACDLLFTKPGGLSSTESVLCRIPTILLDPLSQCECANRDTLVQNRCALAPRSDAARAEWGLRLLESPGAAAKMRAAQAAFLPQNPAEAITDLLEARLC
jgi:processive 1,2-diacylglycerol beta-glucosyltransferase